jgi:hypothetical protein
MIKLKEKKSLELCIKKNAATFELVGQNSVCATNAY